MKNQTIEQAVVETSRHFCNGIALQLKPSNAVMEAIRLLNKELPKALQAQRDAGYQQCLLEIKHEQRKLLDGFGHPKDCAMCLTPPTK